MTMRCTLIRNALLVDSKRSIKGDLLIEGEKIARIADSIDVTTLPSKSTIVEAEGYYLLPGLIDAHTHYHLVSRGTVTADSFFEGSRLAAFGGVTTVIDFADHNKSASLATSANERIEEMEKEMAIDFALHQGVYAITHNLERELTQLKERGVTTIKIFTTYKEVGYLIEREGLDQLFKECEKLEIMVSVHCEDNGIIEEKIKNYRGDFHPSDHPLLRPPEAEAKAIKEVGALAKKYQMPLYVVHLSSLEGLQAIRRLREEGVKVIVETTPHYLFLDNSYLKREEGSLYVMTPPLRSIEDNQALQQALCDGEIDVVATDHCSFTKEQKLSSTDCRTIYPGIPSTEEMFALLYTNFVEKRRLSLSHLVRLLSTNSAALFGLYPKKGSLKVGSDADLFLFDPTKRWKLSAKSLHSAALYTPYEGFEVIGKIEQTFLRGEKIVDEREFYGKRGKGHFVRCATSCSYT